MDVPTLRARVDATLAAMDAVPAAWPDPHPDRDPHPEEYSRCAEPEQYRIVTARAVAWTRTLVELGRGTSDAVTDTGAPWRDGLPGGAPTTRTWWLRPERAGALPLLFGVRGFGGLDDNLLVVGAGHPAVHVDTVPDCGCDACDSGSADLLQQVDDRVLDVVTGEFVHVSTPHGHVTGSRDGWSSDLPGSSAAIGQVLDDARAGRSPHGTVRGLPWW